MVRPLLASRLGPWAVLLAAWTTGSGWSAAADPTKTATTSTTAVAEPLRLVQPDNAPPQQAGEHPLVPALQVALDSYRYVRHEVRDYTCLFIRRERVGHQLGNYEYMQAKVRHRRVESGGQVVPFSVYLKVLKPQSVQGREVLFSQGRYNDQLIVRNGGQRLAYLITQVRPDSELAMRGNRYPLTEFGIENLLLRLIEVAEEDIRSDTPCEVRFYPDAKINGRPCTGVMVRHTEQQTDMRFYLARVFMDRELQVPILYESYDWPTVPGAEPPLLEQYSYQDLQLNVGLTDVDFDRDNHDYHLSRP